MNPNRGIDVAVEASYPSSSIAVAGVAIFQVSRTKLSIPSPAPNTTYSGQFF